MTETVKIFLGFSSYKMSYQDFLDTVVKNSLPEYAVVEMTRKLKEKLDRDIHNHNVRNLPEVKEDQSL